jgi:glycosyltransferase involved in cell wall biosynthesis
MQRSVLHLIDTGGPGGAETVYHNIVTGLNAARWQSVAAVPERDWLYDALQATGITPVLLRTDGSFDFSYLRQLSQLTRSGPAIIHAHLLTSSVYGAIISAWSRIPLVCTFHGAVDVQQQDRLRNLKFGLIRHARAQLVFVSDSLRRTFQSTMRLDDRQTTVVHNGIDTRRFTPDVGRPLRRELDLQDSDLLIGAVGNVRTSKAYDVLLEAASILLQREPSARVVVAGQTNGVLYEQLREQHSQLGLGERFRFLGLCDDIPAIMRSLDIYVSSSSAEGFSLTTVEAMACGVPVVATRSGGPEEIITDGVNGVLVRPNAPEALADAIGSLARDPARRRVLSAAGLARVRERFTVEAMLNKYESIYDQCLNKSRRGRAGRERAGTTATHESG